MQPPFTRQTVQLKPALAGLMVALVLWLGLVASSDRLHHEFHSSPADGPNPCAICSVVRGHMDAPTPVVLTAVGGLSLVWTLPQLESALPLPVDGSGASTRGPPASVSSL